MLEFLVTPDPFTVYTAADISGFEIRTGFNNNSGVSEHSWWTGKLPDETWQPSPQIFNFNLIHPGFCFNTEGQALLSWTATKEKLNNDRTKYGLTFLDGGHLQKENRTEASLEDTARALSDISYIDKLVERATRA